MYTVFDMRRMSGLLALAIVLVVAGCSLLHEPDVSVADVTSIAAPDTVHAGTVFSLTIHAVLGPHGCYELDHTDVTRTGSSLELCVWARDVSNGNAVPCVVTEQDLSFQAGPARTGTFRIVAIRRDRCSIEKTIIVLP